MACNRCNADLNNKHYRFGEHGFYCFFFCFYSFCFIDTTNYAMIINLLLIGDDNEMTSILEVLGIFQQRKDELSKEGDKNWTKSIKRFVSVVVFVIVVCCSKIFEFDNQIDICCWCSCTRPHKISLICSYRLFCRNSNLLPSELLSCWTEIRFQNFHHSSACGWMRCLRGRERTWLRLFSFFLWDRLWFRL